MIRANPINARARIPAEFRVIPALEPAPQVRLTTDKETYLLGETVHISECPEGHGKVKSPMCCGQDMKCTVA